MVEKQAQEIPLDTIVRKLTPKQIEARLETVYNNAVRDAMAQLKSEARGYQDRIAGALRAGDVPAAEKIRDGMPDHFNFNETTQRVEVATGIEGALRSQKNAFVQNVGDVLNTCLLGKGDETVSSARITFGPQGALYADLLVSRLAELALVRPSEQQLQAMGGGREQLVAFDRAAIPAGKLPLVVERARGEPGVQISYASWIAVAPRKANL